MFIKMTLLNSTQRVYRFPYRLVREDVKEAIPTKFGALIPGIHDASHLENDIFGAGRKLNHATAAMQGLVEKIDAAGDILKLSIPQQHATVENWQQVENCMADFFCLDIR